MRLLTLLITALLSLTISIVFAQEKFAEYQLTDAQVIFDEIKLHTGGNGILLADIGDRAGNTRLLIREGAAATVIFRDSIDGKKADDYAEGLKKIRNLQRLATVSNTEVFTDCYYSERKKTAYFAETNIATGQLAATDTVQLDRHQHIITVLEDAGAIYLLYYLEKTDFIYISIKRPGSKLTTVEKTIRVSKNEGGPKKSIPVFADFFKEKKSGSYFVYDNHHPYPSYLSAVKEKIYHFPGKLVFSLENYNLQTNLITLSLKDFKHEYYAVEPPFPFIPDAEEVQRTTSSFLSNDIVFKTGGYKDIFFISATNLYTGAVYCNYIIHTDRPEAIVNSPFFKEARYNELAARHKLSLGEYLDMSAIGVTPAAGNLYNIEISSLHFGMNWAQVLVSLAASAAGTYALNSAPGLYDFSIFVFGNYKTLLIKNTLDISTGNFVNAAGATISSDNWDNKIAAVNKFMEQNEDWHSKAEAVLDGTTVYVYYVDFKTEKLVLYKF